MTKFDKEFNDLINSCQTLEQMQMVIKAFKLGVASNKNDLKGIWINNKKLEKIYQLLIEHFYEQK